MLDFQGEGRRSAAFIGADYEEFKPETMKGYFIYIDDVKGQRRFESLQDAVNHASLLANSVFTLSSCDNYAADVRRGAQ